MSAAPFAKIHCPYCGHVGEFDPESPGDLLCTNEECELDFSRTSALYPDEAQAIRDGEEYAACIMDAREEAEMERQYQFDRL